MILPLIIIIASWILVLSVIAGLCLSARQGDLQQRETAPAYPAGDPIAAPVISASIAARSSRRAYPCNPGLTSGATSATG
jgi:hypothetical protein